MKKFILTALFLGLVLFIAACGSDNDTSGNNDSGSDNNASSAAQVDISATNFEFDQAEYTVSAGEEVKVSLTNDDGHHGIGIDEFDVNIEGEGSATFTPDEPGEYTIYCNVPCGQGHADMTSTLIVE